MGNLILCSEPNAKIPYYAESIGARLYNGAELSYFIYNDLMAVLGENFLDDRLMEFIGTGLARPDLAGKLGKWRNDMDESELLLVILQDLHYYDAAELKKFQERLRRITMAPAEEQKKAKADYMLGRRWYYSALRLYAQLLSRADDRNGNFIGRVWYNQGLAQAGLFSFDQAAESFLRAKEILKEPEILKMIFFIRRIDTHVELPPEVFGEVSGEMLGKWEDECDEAMSQVGYQGKALDIACLKEKDRIKRAEGFAACVEKWKDEYKRG